MPTTAIPRPLITAAISISVAFTCFAQPASAARGADTCPGATDIPDTAAKLDTAAAAITCLVNAERASRGLGTLKRDSALQQAARDHSRDMIRRDYFDHTSPGGQTVGDRVREAGYGKPGDGWSVGENLGWGTGGRAAPNALVDAWLASSGHRKNMLKASFKELGVGVSQGAPKKDGRLPGATYTLNLGVIR